MMATSDGQRQGQGTESAAAAAAATTTERRREAVPDPRRGLLRRSAPRQDRARPAPLPGRGRGRRARLGARRRDDGGEAGRRRPSTTRSASARPRRVVGVATSGGRFPPAWRELLRAVHRAGPRRRVGAARVPRRRPGAGRARGAPRGRAARPAPAARRAQRPDRGEPRASPPGSSPPSAPTARSGRRRSPSSSTSRRAAAGSARSFVPTGQTGILIAGWGIAVDAVVADFLAGAAERLVVEGWRRGGEDLLVVEGQGSLVHPDYSGVTHGAAPRERAARARPLPPGRRGPHRGPAGPPDPAAAGARRALRAGHAARPARAAWSRSPSTRGCSTRTRRAAAIAAAEAETGLPADDPVRFGAARVVDAVTQNVVRFESVATRRHAGEPERATIR